MLDFYKIGLRDGDRFWTYNLAPLSQFFHNFISGPVNDPRLEAYLAGVYTSWIIKAALGVSMGEFRHGIGSSRANIPVQRVFAHILMQQSIAGESGVDNLFSRGEYYQRINYNELGYDMIHSIAEFYSDSYDPDVTEWRDGSFGGEKYYNSTYPTRDASYMILQMLQGKEVKLQTLLNSVNQLENAVHNTGFFFNKFLGDKSAFDIGTGGHGEFASACEHWLVTAPFYALFYTNYVNEPHRVAEGHDKLIKHLYAQANRREKMNGTNHVKMREQIPAFLAIADDEGTLKENIEIVGLQEHEHFYTEQILAGFNMHKKGMCGFTECTVGECKQAAILIEMGIDENVLHILLDQLNEFMECPTLSFPQVPDTLEKVTEILTTQGSRSLEATAFTKAERDVNNPEVEVIEIRLGKNIVHPKMIWTIQCNTSDIKWVYIDHLLHDWWDEICTTIEELGEEGMIAQYEAWRNPTEWIGEDIMDEVEALSEILRDIGQYSIYSRYWSTSTYAFQTPMGIIKSMMVAHEGRYHYTAHSLLKELHEAGKINENKGEIIE